MKKKLMAVILSLALLIASGSTALAADSTITIKSDTSGYTYEAYQVFSGTVTTEGKLENVQWGTGVDSSTLLTALATLDSATFNTSMTAAQAASAIQSYAADTAKAEALAQVIGSNVTTTSVPSTYSDSTYSLAVGEGYYLVKNTTVPTDGSYTSYILTLSGVKDVTPKASVPSVEKKIEKPDATNLVDADTWTEGDTHTFHITGTLPSNSADYTT